MSARPTVAVIGTGLVGSALIARIEEAGCTLAYRASSRGACSRTRRREGPVAPEVLASEVVQALAGAALPVVVDATASDEVGALHPGWLARGLDVVTANKAGAGASLARWQAIARATREAGSRYGDSATVGAGLPVLRTLRRLRAAGEPLLSLRGLLSGSLAWLCDRPVDETLEHRVREAQRLGYCEPDPAEDLSGRDVARKLLILARACGHAAASVAVDPVRPGTFETVARDAQARGHVVRYIARLDEGGAASAALETVPADDPLGQGRGNELRIAIRTTRYDETPIVLQGPGAGARLTAAALLDDVLALCAAPARAAG